MSDAFAVWITGLPASGKSTLAAAFLWELRSRGIDAVHLESDALRRVLTPRPHFSEEERGVFYGAMAWIGRLLVEHGHPAILDGTAQRRAYRELARRDIPRFLEVHVDTPISVCRARDPKGLYRKAGPGGTLPGLQTPYEPPEDPDLHVRGDREDAGAAARRLLALVESKGWLFAPATYPG